MDECPLVQDNGGSGEKSGRSPSTIRLQVSRRPEMDAHKRQASTIHISFPTVCGSYASAVSLLKLETCTHLGFTSGRLRYVCVPFARKNACVTPGLLQNLEALYSPFGPENTGFLKPYSIALVSGLSPCLNWIDVFARL